MKKTIRLIQGVSLMMVALVGFTFSASAQIADTTSVINSWATLAFEEGIQTGEFTFEFDMIPEKDIIDAVTALTNVETPAGSGYADMSAIVRFSSGGKIDVHNGSTYAAETEMTYAAGSTYSVRMEVNTSMQMYSVFVSENGDPEVTLATDFSFRKKVINLTHMGIVAGDFGFDPKSDAGTHQVKNIVLTVISTNNTPVIDMVMDQVVQEGSSKDVAILAQDPLNKDLTLKGVDLPSFVTLTDNGSGMGVLNIAPQKDCSGCDLGRYTVTIEASNGTETATSMIDVKIKEYQATTSVSTTTEDNSVYFGAEYDPAVPFSWTTNTVIYAGGQVYYGGPNGDGIVNTAAVMPFKLPARPEGQKVGAAQFDVQIVSGTSWMQYKIDLYGLDSRSTATVEGTDYFQGAFGSDASATSIQEVWANNATVGGPLSTSPDANKKLAEYLNAQYDAGAVEGDYVFIRANVQQTETPASHQYARLTIASADDATGNTTAPVLSIQFFTPNEAPVIEAIDDMVMIEQRKDTVTISATDAESDALTFEVMNAPSFAALTDNGDGSAYLALAPTREDIGEYMDVIVSVFDGEDYGFDTLNITVNANSVPVLEATEDLMALIGEPLTVTVNASDADGDALNFSLSNAPDFVTIADNEDGTSAALVVSADADAQAGEYADIVITVTDTYDNVTDTITLTVEIPLTVDALSAQATAYPNPTKYGSVTLSLPSEFDGSHVSVSIMSITGQVMHQYDLKAGFATKELTITMDDNLRQGQYILQVSNASQTITKRIIKQ